MKKFVLSILLLALPLLFPARNAGASVPKEKLLGIISEYKVYEGVEVVRVGRVGTSAIKSMIRLAALTEDDPDIRDAMRIIAGIKRVVIMEFEDCDDWVRERICFKLDKALSGSDLLMEVKDGDSGMSMYGVVSDDSSVVKDFVLYSPADCTLICMFGSLSMDAVTRLASSGR